MIQDHLEEMLSVVYTPTEGDAIQNYSRLFRRPEGCYLSIHDQESVHPDLAKWGNPEDIDYIVVTGMSLRPEPSRNAFTHSSRWGGDSWHR